MNEQENLHCCESCDCKCESQKKEVLTEVTTIAKEEERTGQKMAKISPEELVQKASISLMRCRKQLTTLFGEMSKKQTIRAINAIFDLPADKLPVLLKSDEEKLAFALGQRAFTDKFIIIQHHINEQMKALKEKGINVNEKVEKENKIEVNKEIKQETQTNEEV